MKLIPLIAVIVVTALLAVLLRQQRPEQAMLLSLLAGTVILIALLSEAGHVIASVNDLLNKSGLPSEYTQVLLKGLGVCLLTQLASDTCKDAGEVAMAAKAELVGQISLAVVGLPLFEKIATAAVSLIGG